MSAPSNIVGTAFQFLTPDDAGLRAAVIENFTLDGVGIDAHVSDAIQDIQFERTIEGASTVSIMIIDPLGDLLDSGLFSHKVDAELPAPGLGFTSPSGLPLPTGQYLAFRLVRVKTAGAVLTLEFEDREVAYLRGHKSLLHASRADVTRAEFVRRMVREVKASTIRFWSPELHKTQPIGTSKDLPKASTKKEQRQSGFGSYTPKIKRHDATREQIRVIEQVLETAAGLHASEKVMIAAIAGITQESEFKNYRGTPAGGHLINVGIMQQDSRYWPATRNVPKDVTPFLTRLKTVVAQQGKSHNLGWCVDQVQRSYTFGTSRQGADYDQWESEARDTVAAWSGDASLTAGSPTSTSYRKRYEFRRGEPGGKREDSWTASGRLAAEVNFRRFVDMGVFHYVSDDYLLKSAPRLTLKRKDLPDGVISVRIADFDVAKPQAEVTVEVFADVLQPPIGAVWVLDGYGPCDGRYLIKNVRGSYLKAITTVTLALPVPKLPEPAAEIGTKTAEEDDVRRSVAGGNLADAYAEALRISAKRYPYVWGGGHAHAGTPDGGTGRDRGIGFDCSGYVAAVLHAGGMLPKGWTNGVPPSGTFANAWGEAGTGSHLTVYANAGHVFMEFKNMTDANKTEHFGTGDWGSGWDGGGRKPRLHFHQTFTARRWNSARHGSADGTQAPQTRRPDI